MKQHHHIIGEMLAEYGVLLEELLTGRGLSRVVYAPETDAQWGIYDRNHKNRHRVLVAMQFCFWQQPQRYEALLRRLFEEEIKDRETNSFQGIGEALQRGAWMLQHFDAPQDKTLFARAKQANFDTACGFDVADLHPTYFHKQLEDMDLEYCIYTALSLEEEERASRLIDLWIAEQDSWDSTTLRRLASLEKARNNLLGQVGAWQQLEALSESKEKAREHCAILQELAACQLAAGIVEKAAETAARLRGRIAEVPDWQRVGFGRRIMEVMVDLILVLEPRQAEEIWSWSRPVLQQMGSMPLGLLEKTALAADKMGDAALAEQKRQKLAQEKQKLEQDR